MKTLLALLLATLCAATSYGQTLKALAYNTTNGAVVYNGTNPLTFTNGFRLLDGATTIIDLANDAASDFFYGIVVGAVIEFSGTNAAANAAATRTNFGLPLNTLTNDSNVKLMRALSGSTNTNHPFSGSVSVVGTNNTNTLVFSNGILQSVQ